MTTTNVFATRYYGDGGMLSNISSDAITQPFANLVVSNSMTTTNVFATRYYGDGGLLSNISSDAITQPFANLVVSNSVTTTNVFATRYYGDGGLLSNISSDAITQPFANLVVSNAVTTTNVIAINYLTVNQPGLSTSYTLTVAGSGTIGAGGDIVAFTSDERLKMKTGRLTDALNKVCSLETFTYVNNDLAQSFGFTDSRSYVGVSAQQVRKVQPEIVRLAPFDSDGGEKSKSGENYMTVQYERLVPLLIEALKEERKAREALDERIKILEKK
jgi:hypothetical protein